MIFIRRDSICPEIKDAKGDCRITKANQSIIDAFDNSPDSYMNGEKTFSFDSSIYGHELIKSKLIKAQYGKCAFCESNITPIDYGDVEHFRPKGGVSQNDKCKITKPGYYWLAYDWNNLLLACSICNRRYKKNLFPLINPECRAINHTQSKKLKSEKPFFVNPTSENPKFFIKFKEATAKGIDKKHRGKKTIEALNLNRKGEDGISDLYEMRLTHFQLVECTYFIAASHPNERINQVKIDNAKELMIKLRSPNNHYSAMVNDNFPLLKKSK